MKTLVVFYSRTGNTKEVGEAIAKLLDCDYEEIIDTKNRDGIVGYFVAGKDAAFKKLTEIGELTKDPAEYDLVIIGTPIWAFTLVPAIRTYLGVNQHKFKKVAFFCTQGGKGAEKAFEVMEQMTSKPLATAVFIDKDIVKSEYMDKVKEFVEKLIEFSH